MQANQKNQTICIKTNQYELKSTYQNDMIQFSLIENPAKPKKQFESTIKFINIPRQIRQKFLTLQNFFCYLADKQNITVDCNRGTIAVNLLVKLGNGKVISTTKLGQIALTQIVSIKDPLQIMKICKSPQRLSQQKVKQILYGVAQNIIKFDIRSVFPTNQKFTEQEQDLTKCKQKINAIIISVDHHETQIRNMKLNNQKNNQKVQKYVLTESKNWGAASLQNIGGEMDKKIETMKKQMLEQLNYTIGQIQTQIIKLTQKVQPPKQSSSHNTFNAPSIFKNPSSSETYNYGDYKPSHTSTNSTQNTNNSNNPVPLNTKGASQSISNIDEIHKLIKARTNKKLKKMSKNTAYFKVNKKDNFLNYFQFGQDGGIRYVNKENRRIMLFGTQTLLSNNIFSFRIGNSKEKCIGFGIVDSAYSKQSVCRIPQTRPNMIYYEAHTGKIFEGPNYVGKQSNGINQGEVLLIYANLQLGLIAWVVNGQIRANYITPKIVDHSIEWVPMIIFNHYDDIVEIFEEDK